MTNLVDLDRALADFLEDGPNTAPEAPVIAAMAHARTTPRRPDPLGPFRRDVMSAPWRPFGLRPALVLSLLALVAAGIAVAVGSRPSEGPSVVVPSPTAAPSAGPSAAPSTSAAPSAVPAFSSEVTMLVSGGQPYPLQISDVTGELIDARSLQPGDGASVDGVDVKVDPADPTALIVTWVGTPCERNGSLKVDERARTIAILRDPCQGDTFPLDRIVRLKFAGIVQAGDWTSSIDDGSFPTRPAKGSTAP